MSSNTHCSICKGYRRKSKRTPYGLQKHDKSGWCLGCDSNKTQEVNKKAERQKTKRNIKKEVDKE